MSTGRLRQGTLCRLLLVGASIGSLLQLAACGDGRDGDGWTVAADTVEGGAIHVTHTPPATEAVATWRLVEELRIGSVDAEGPASFGDLRGLAVTRDGRIAVLDAQAQELRVFDPRGRHLATHGGTGRGPGEMEGAFGLMLAPDGTLWVPDSRNARMSIYDLEAGFVDSHELSVVSRDYVWRGIMTSDGRILKQSATFDPSPRGVLRVYGSEMTLEDVLPLPGPFDRTQAVAPGLFHVSNAGFESFLAIPFFPQGHTLLDPRGGIWSTERGDPSYRIKRWTAGGDTTLVVTTRRPPSRLAASVRDSAIDAVRQELRELGGARQDWSRVPDVWPAVTSMFLAEEGTLWVEAAAAEETRTYDVYERTGHYLGTALSALGVLRAIHPVVREDRFWAVVIGDLDVQYVVRASIVEAPG